MRMPISNRFRLVGPHQTPIDNEEYKRLRSLEAALNKLFVGEQSLGTEMERINRRLSDLSASYIDIDQVAKMEYLAGKLDGMRIVLDQFDRVRRNTAKAVEEELPF